MYIHYNIKNIVTIFGEVYLFSHFLTRLYYTIHMDYYFNIVFIYIITVDFEISVGILQKSALSLLFSPLDYILAVWFAALLQTQEFLSHYM